MPTNLRLYSDSFTANWVGVLATENGLRSAPMLTIDVNGVAADALGLKWILPGELIARLPSGFGRIYPASTVTANPVTASSTSFTVKMANRFAVGEALTIPVPYARLDFGGTWANGDTATLTMDGQSVTYTVVNFTNLTALAAAFATAITNATPAAFRRVEAIAENQYVHLFGARTYAISVSKTGAGTLTIDTGATALQSGVAVGTVQAIDPITNTVTLTAASLRRLPIGGKIGVATPATIVGMVLSPWDLTKSSNDVAAYTSATVYGARLPYWDKAISALLPEITLVP